jgi:Fur family transcriptional regulator, ferric uptake regulator
MINPEKILAIHGLSRTQCRVDLLQILLDTGSAISDTKIRNELKGSYDRATLFRTLRTFLEKGVMHSIAVDGQDMRYALSEHEYSENDTHVHFHCKKCANVYCMKDVNLSKPMLPKGFMVNECEVIVNGICKECAG